MSRSVSPERSRELYQSAFMEGDDASNASSSRPRIEPGEEDHFTMDSSLARPEGALVPLPPGMRDRSGLALARQIGQETTVVQVSADALQNFGRNLERGVERAAREGTNQALAGFRQDIGNDISRAGRAVAEVQRKAMEELQTRLLDIGDQLDTANAQRDRLIAQIEDSHNQIVSLHSKVEHGNTQLAVANRKLDAVQREAAENQQVLVGKLSDAEKAAQERQLALQKKLADTEQVIVDLNQQHTEAMATFREDMNGRIDKLTAEINAGGMSHAAKNAAIVGLATALALQSTVVGTPIALGAGALTGASYAAVMALYPIVKTLISGAKVLKTE